MIFVLSFFLISCQSAIYEPPVLNDNTFEKKLKDSPVNFVMVSRQNVSFCQEILPKFRAVAELLKDKCQFVILDENESNEMKRKYGFFAFPSFFVFRYANYSAEYKGERDAQSFLRYLKRITGDLVIELESARDVSDYLEEIDSAVIFAADDMNDSNNQNYLSIFKKVAENLTDLIPFAIATSSDAVQQLSFEELPAIRLYRNQDRQVLDFPIAFGLKQLDLQNWIRSNLIPRYSARNAVTFRDLALDSRYSILSFVDTSRKNSLDSMHNAMNQLVTEFGNNFTYVYSDIFDVGTIVLQLGFTGTRDLVFCIAMLDGGEVTEKYLFPEMKNPSPSNVCKWVRKFMNTTMKNRQKRNQLISEEPVKDQKGPFYKIVGTEFVNATQDPKFDVVTLILSGNEKARKDAMKLVETVSIEFKKQKVRTVKFNYIDFELNGIPGLTKESFKELPAILLFPATKEKRPFLLPVSVDIPQLMNLIVGNAHSRFRFKIPGKYDSGTLEL